MTENGKPKSPAWMKDSREWRPMADGLPPDGGCNVDLCRAALLEILHYMNLDLDETGRRNLESYDGEQIRALMVKIQGFLQ
jgi:hypothetical protein